MIKKVMQMIKTVIYIYGTAMYYIIKLNIGHKNAEEVLRGNIIKKAAVEMQRFLLGID